jgi:predicted RNase H-like HicB family nuclease
MTNNQNLRTPEKYLAEPYTRILVPNAESGGYNAEILEFPGCVSQGETVQEAYDNLEDAAYAWLEAALELGQSIPPPAENQGYSGKIALRLPRSLHRQAAMMADRDGVSLNQYLVVAIANQIAGARSTGQLSPMGEFKLIPVPAGFMFSAGSFIGRTEAIWPGAAIDFRLVQAKTTIVTVKSLKARSEEFAMEEKNKSHA